MVRQAHHERRSEDFEKALTRRGRYLDRLNHPGLESASEKADEA